MSKDTFDDFITHKPRHHFLATLIDYYFFIDTPIDKLKSEKEDIVQFPRITFGYFFEHPFLVTNHDLEQSMKVDMVISRVSSHKITVLPLTERIKILGAHVKPYALAYLTKKPICSLPWLIRTEDLFKTEATSFRKRVAACRSNTEMFEEVERIFLKTLLSRQLSKVVDAVNLIEGSEGNIKILEVANHVRLTERALRDQFHSHIGCSPKEFIQLVQVKKTVEQMKFTEKSLTEITYNNHYFDQPHFINSFRKITGKSPGELRKNLLDFRFLQF